MGKPVLLKGGKPEAEKLFKAGKLVRYFETDDKFYGVFKVIKKAPKKIKSPVVEKKPAKSKKGDK